MNTGKEFAAMTVKDRSEAVKKCLEALAVKSTVILAPTETVYGLICDWDDASARERIYKLKHRAENKPFAAFVPSVAHVSKYVTEIPRAARILAEKFCPGPITIIIPDGKGSTFGFRIPDHPFIIELLKASGRTFASTSANLSGRPAALNVDDALASIDGEPEVVVDWGSLPPDSKASTVVMVNADSSWKILRDGPLSHDDIISALK